MFENPVSYMENPYGYYYVVVQDRYGNRIANLRARGPLARAQSAIRSKLRKSRLTQISQRSYIVVTVG